MILYHNIYDMWFSIKRLKKNCTLYWKVWNEIVFIVGNDTKNPVTMVTKLCYILLKVVLWRDIRTQNLVAGAC